MDCSFLYTIIDDLNLFINLLKLASGSETVYQHISTPWQAVTILL